ncbi:hypothetical protein pEaSNUABM11_00282 [Erwinia phage pEa_SNUABM_11]|nr:hypothetical protein pEaSNUABM11_00282 [Erwinia phage pEa_SNUABM_11]
MTKEQWTLPLTVKEAKEQSVDHPKLASLLTFVIQRLSDTLSPLPDDGFISFEKLTNEQMPLSDEYDIRQYTIPIDYQLGMDSPYVHLTYKLPTATT